MIKLKGSQTRVEYDQEDQHEALRHCSHAANLSPIQAQTGHFQRLETESHRTLTRIWSGAIDSRSLAVALSNRLSCQWQSMTEPECHLSKPMQRHSAGGHPWAGLRGHIAAGTATHWQAAITGALALAVTYIWMEGGTTGPPVISLRSPTLWKSKQQVLRYPQGLRIGCDCNESARERERKCLRPHQTLVSDP